MLCTNCSKEIPSTDGFALVPSVHGIMVTFCVDCFWEVIEDAKHQYGDGKFARVGAGAGSSGKAPRWDHRAAAPKRAN